MNLAKEPKCGDQKRLKPRELFSFVNGDFTYGKLYFDTESFRLARRAGVLARQINQEPVELALRGAISAGKTPGRIM